LAFKRMHNAYAQPIQWLVVVWPKVKRVKKIVKVPKQRSREWGTSK
jgi:hypothetical protein